jgi:hypothetical protein
MVLLYCIKTFLNIGYFYYNAGVQTPELNNLIIWTGQTGQMARIIIIITGKQA